MACSPSARDRISYFAAVAGREGTKQQDGGNTDRQRLTCQQVLSARKLHLGSGMRSEPVGILRDGLGGDCRPRHAEQNCRPRPHDSRALSASTVSRNPLRREGALAVPSSSASPSSSSGGGDGLSRTIGWWLETQTPPPAHVLGSARARPNRLRSTSMKTCRMLHSFRQVN